MRKPLFYPVGTTDACTIAARQLKLHGIALIDHPSPDVTHLLLDVPSFDKSGLLRGGGEIGQILERLPQDIHILGGMLQHPALDGYRTTDLLTSQRYLFRNASITAHCAMILGFQRLPLIPEEIHALILGFGRIGKCLGFKLKALGCQVTIAARKASDRAMADALGFSAISIEEAGKALPRFRLVYNTIPSMVLSEPVPKGCVAIELASQPGISHENVIQAPGLPGSIAPESSGHLIAESILSILYKEA